MFREFGDISYVSSMAFVVFFFKQKTAYEMRISDWSSDVCSSDLLRYQVGELDDGKAEYSVLVPRRITGTPILGYAVRTDPARRDAVHAAIPQVLERAFGAELMPDIGVRVDDYESLRRDALKPRRAAVWLLATVCAVVTFITLVG